METNQASQDIETVAEDKLVTTTVKEYMTTTGYVSVVPFVRVNTNGYPYITFIDKDNVAENIYFSKNAAMKVAANDKIARGFFEPFCIAITKNAAGEERIKISTSERLSVEDLF